MKAKALIVIALCMLGSTFVLGQRGGGGGRGDQPPSPLFTLAPDIPGVVKGGTKVELIKEGFMGAQGATQGPDGSLLFTERMANRITKIDKDGGVYFTDDLGIPDNKIKPAVYYVKPTGGLIKIADDIARPNGLVLSPDERTLYVLDTNTDKLKAFDV